MIKAQLPTWMSEEFGGRYDKKLIDQMPEMLLEDWKETLASLDYYAAVCAIKDMRKAIKWIPDLAEFETKAKEYEKQHKQAARPAEDKGAVKEWIVNCRGVFKEKHLIRGMMPNDNDISEMYNRMYCDVKRGDQNWHVVSKTFRQMCSNRSKHNTGAKQKDGLVIPVTQNRPPTDELEGKDAVGVTDDTVPIQSNAEFFKDAKGMSAEDYDNMF